MDFQFQLDTLKATRSNTRNILSKFSLEELNKIPNNFNNNLIWNYGHMIVTQQILCYKYSNLNAIVTEDVIIKYRKGSRPTSPVNQNEFEILKGLDYKTIQQLESDYVNNTFKLYDPYQTKYGVVINNIDNAIIFNNLHEAHHFGNILSMRKIV